MYGSQMPTLLGGHFLTISLSPWTLRFSRLWLLPFLRQPLPLILGQVPTLHEQQMDRKPWKILYLSPAHKPRTPLPRIRLRQGFPQVLRFQNHRTVRPFLRKVI